MKTTIIKAISLVLFLSLGIVHSGLAKDLKVAFVYVGPVGDGGWTYSHDLGRKHLESLGAKTTYVESDD